MTFALPIMDCQRCPLGAAVAPTACRFVCEQRAASSDLLSRGGPVESVTFIRRGYVSLTHGPGEAQSLRGPGAILGLECLVPKAATHTITTLTDADLCRLPRDAFLALSGAQPALISALLVTEIAQRDVEAGFRSGSSQTRIARFLLERLRRGGGAYPLPFATSSLAGVLGLRSERLRRALNRLRREGVIHDGDGLVVRDAQALADHAIGKRSTDLAIVPRT